MALIRKKVTPQLAAANRANSLKSTGPRTATGKIRSSRNSIKSGIHSNPLLVRLKAFGEDSAEFEELHRALLYAFVPRDRFEHMLVEDMAVLRWRRLRLCRAEVEAWDHREMLAVKNFLTILKYAIDKGSEKTVAEHLNSSAKKVLSEIEKDPERYGSLSRLPEDPMEFGTLFYALWGFVDDFKGFDQTGLKSLRSLYGAQPGFGGSALLTRYEEYLRDEERADATARARNRESFLKALHGELSFYTSLYKLTRRAENEGRNKAAARSPGRWGRWQVGLESEPQIEDIEDSPGFPPGEDLDKITRYEAHLERQFERKLQQLVAWRRVKEGAASATRNS